MNLHTSFKLAAAGEYVALVAPDGTVVSEFGPAGSHYPSQTADISYGTAAGGVQFFDDPTPGLPNVQGQLGQVSEPAFSVGRGFFIDAFDVTIAAPPGATIRYTTDGSEPTDANGIVYSGAVSVDRTMTIRAAAFQPGYLPSPIETHTYIFVADVMQQSPGGEVPPGFPAGLPSGSRINGQLLDYGMTPEIVNDPEWGPQMETALLGLPTMSIVTDIEHLFDPASGIYVHAGARGQQWERPVSLELIHPDGQPGFQVEAGLRLRGGFSRTGDNPKHAFRLFFRGEYGDPQLEFPLFGDEGADVFQNIDLRTPQNYSWAFQADRRNTFLRDVFSRDTQRDMGQPYTRSRYYHLYINGHYWGLFQTQERAEADFAATYFGGDPEDYDVIKSAGNAGGYVAEATDGNMDAYWMLYDSTLEGLKSNDVYYRIQGLNPDGTVNPQYPRLLDADNLIDYMLITYYSRDRDGPASTFVRPRTNNFFGIFNRENPDGFKWFEHDSEHSLDTGSDTIVTSLFTAGAFDEIANRASFNPHWLHEKLMENADYRQRFTDAIEKHFGPGGALSTEAALERWDQRTDEIAAAMIAESARWGNAQGGGVGFTQDVWSGRVDAVRSWIESRNDLLFGQFEANGWLSEVETPRFDPAASDAAGPGDVSISAPDGALYYTLDGTDPRLPGGEIHPDAVRYDPFEVYVDRNAPARYLVPTEGQIDAEWMSPEFDDSEWTDATASLGFDTGQADPSIRVESGFTVEQFFSTGIVTSLAGADALIGGEGVASQTLAENVPAINFLDTGDDGNFPDNMAFPGGGGDDFAIRATATLLVTAEGTYSFAVNTDEGSRLKIDGDIVSNDNAQHRPRNLLVPVFLTEGTHELEFVMFERMGGAAAELAFAAGDISSFDERFELLGQDDSLSFAGSFSSDVRADMHGQNSTVYVRAEFDVMRADDVEILILRMKHDDGFVAYLNGTEIARRNVEGTPQFDTTASTARPDSFALVDDRIIVTEFAHLLRNGTNVLAVQGLNVSADDPDFLLAANLEGGLAGSPLNIVQSTELKARAFVDGAWSALAADRYLLPTPLTITEVHYHPADPSDDERAVNADWNDNDFEFVELTNVGAEAIPLARMAFTDGFAFDFDDAAVSTLAAGQSLVVVRNRDAFETRYGEGILIAGEFADGGLNNGGERIVLRGSAGETVVDFTYADSGDWPARADGSGSSLRVIDPHGDLSDADNWHASDDYSGTPGVHGTRPTPDVLINEVLPASDSGPHTLELANVSVAPVDISGWWLTADIHQPNAFSFPAGSIVAAGQYGVFEIDAELIPPAEDSRLWLLETDPSSNKPLRFADEVLLESAGTGLASGRWPDADARALLLPMREPTLGQVNSGPEDYPIVISELDYNPRLFRFEQHFDPGSTPAFSPEQGMWEIDAGRYVVTPVENNDTMAPLSEPFELNEHFVISTLVHVAGDSAFSKNAAILFDYQSAENFKFASIHMGAGSWRIGQYDSNGWNYISRFNGDAPADVDLDVRVEINGSLVTVWSGDVIKVRHNFNSPLHEGRVGLGSRRGQVAFDEFAVTPIDDQQQYEFVELHNRSDGIVDLEGWELAGGIDFRFPAGVSAGPGETLVVAAFDPSDTEAAGEFRRLRGIADHARILGPYSGKLNNDGERVQLLMPAGQPQPQVMLVVDQIDYDDDLPWPLMADGQGPSLHRTAPAAFGNTARNWLARSPSPGTVQFVTRGDLNLDGLIDMEDIGAFALALTRPHQYETTYGVPADIGGDIDGDGDVDFDDIDDLVGLLVGGAAAATHIHRSDPFDAQPAESTDGGQTTPADTVPPVGGLFAPPQPAPAESKGQRREWDADAVFRSREEPTPWPALSDRVFETDWS